MSNEKQSPSFEVIEGVYDLAEKMLGQFHLRNESGKITGVFDAEIHRFIKASEADIFVLGGVVYIYDGGVYRADTNGARLKTMIREKIIPRFIKSTTIKRIYDLFIFDADLQVTTDDLNQYPVEWINFRNGFYDPRSKRMIPHDPKYRAVNQIPFDYSPDGQIQTDTVADWLDKICEDPDDKEMLLQFAGLCLTRDTRQQKFLILCGDGGTGKSTVIRMIEKMVGAENSSNISLNQLTQRFQAFGLMGKLLNSCADLEIDALSDTSVLKKALGEDTFSAESKGKDQISVRNYAKLLFSTNQLPIVKSEQTNGFYRRLLILTMNRVPERQDPTFFDQLSERIEEFLRLCVQALERLYSAGQITESASSVAAVKRLRCDSDTVEAFLTEQTVKRQDGRIKKLDLYRKYERFCLDMERQSLTKQNFYRSLRTKGFGEIKTNGAEFFRGLELREKVPKTSPEISLNEWAEIPDGLSPFG